MHKIKKNLKTGKTPGYLLRENACMYLLKKIDNIKKVLEIGPGDGNFIQRLYNKYHCNYTVLEASKEAFGFLNLKFKNFKNIKILNKYYNICIKGKKFDTIIFLEVLEHQRYDLDFLKEIKKNLKNDGYILFSVPAHSKYWSYHDEISGHFRRYDKIDIIQILKKSKFKLIKIINYGFPFTNFTYYFNKIISKIMLKRTKDNKYKRTLKSGFNIKKKYYFNNMIFNNLFFFPFIIFQRIFFNLNFGMGYIILAKNNKKIEFLIIKCKN